MLTTEGSNAPKEVPDHRAPQLTPHYIIVEQRTCDSRDKAFWIRLGLVVGAQRMVPSGVQREQQKPVSQELMKSHTT